MHLEPTPALRPGSRVRLVAPSGPFDREGFDKAIALLSARYTLSFDERIFDRKGYFAGDDGARLAELRAAIADPDADAILVARGGYGLTRIVDAIDVRSVARAKKTLVGFSDATVLHATWARASLRSIHGHMFAALGRASATVVERWIAAVEGAVPAAVSGLTPLTRGLATGGLVGGNLAVLAALLGTPYFPPVDGCVLFLEDVTERPYRVDRMLTSLRLAGVLDRVAAVALGAFSECEPAEDGVCVEDVLRDVLGKLRVPVVAGVPAGHIEDNLELPFGAPVTVDAGAGRLVFHESAVR